MGVLGSIIKQRTSKLTPGVDCWVIDTGSGHNLVPAHQMTEQEQQSLVLDGPELRLATANGIIRTSRVAESSVTGLMNDIGVRVLESTPRVLSVFQLVQNGAKFEWDTEGARLRFGNKTIDLEVDRGVPLLALACVPNKDTDE